MNTTAAALDQSAASPAQLDDSCCGGVGARGIIARSATRRKAVELGQPSWFTPPSFPRMWLTIFCQLIASYVPPTVSSKFTFVYLDFLLLLLFEFPARN